MVDRKERWKTEGGWLYVCIDGRMCIIYGYGILLASIGESRPTSRGEVRQGEAQVIEGVDWLSKDQLGRQRMVEDAGQQPK